MQIKNLNILYANIAFRINIHRELRLDLISNMIIESDQSRTIDNNLPQ